MIINQRKFIRINRNINSSTVRVKQDGEHLGIMPIQQALDLAYREGLDLVEIAPDAVPPVCEIMNFGKYKYQEKINRKKQQAKAKSVGTKQIRLRPVSGDHDIQTKINQLRKFLSDKHPVSVNIVFKNREMTHKDLGFQIMKRIIEAVEEVGQQVAPPRFEGSRLNVRLFPKTKE